LASPNKVYAADYLGTTPAMLTVAVLDMQAAYVDATTRPFPIGIELGASGNIGGLTFTPGIYKWSTVVTTTSDITFSGGPSDIWIMQIAQTYALAVGVNMNLVGGAQAENIFWAIAGVTAFFANSHAVGIFLAMTNITFENLASLNGAALAQTAVTMISNTIVKESACGIVQSSF